MMRKKGFLSDLKALDDVYVDELRPHELGIFKRGCCHMMSKDLERLHAVAAEIGLKREWFQAHSNHPHYDLTPKRRIMALKAGAVEISSREMLEICCD